MKYLFALALLFCFACQAATLMGRVVGVADGDTVTVLDADKVQHKIRLAGIDAPEKSQPFGNSSKASLSDLVFSKDVTVEIGKKDRYGREVGKIFVGRLDANLEQVRRGFAWHYKAYQREQSLDDRETYERAEIEAREAKRGLWLDVDPVPPWDFRKSKRGG